MKLKLLYVQPLFLLLLVPHSLPFTPNIRINERMNNYPKYLKNNSKWQEHLAASASSNSMKTVTSPSVNDFQTTTKATNASVPAIREDLVKSAKFGDFSKIASLLDNPLANFFEAGSKMKYLKTLTRNDTSRFFSLDSATQALNLGVSFTVPFLSVPMDSIIKFGESTTSALMGMMNINLPSLVITAVLIGAAALIIPQIANVLGGLFSQVGFPTDIFSSIFKKGNGTRAYDNYSSYSEYMRSLEVAPFTSILDQIESAMAEYDLDSTSCMQRVVCTYVAEAEEAVDRGSSDPQQLIIKGLTRSSWVQELLGDNALTEALEVGRIGTPCSKQFHKCPFSLPGILKLLSRLAFR